MEKLKYYFSNYVEVAREVKELVNREVKAGVFVFGSVVRGDYCVGLSDIDVAIVSSDFEDREKKLRVYSLLYEKCFESPPRIPLANTKTVGIQLETQWKRLH
jgi:predicted nucleotidyltransferase